MNPDNKAAIEFLERYEPDGPWVVTSIKTDRKAITTATFYPGTRDNLLKWLKEYNGNRNIYFHVNPPTRDLSKKAERENIKSLSWLHVDVDPRAGEDIDEERERALALLTEKLPKGVPAPTCVIFSGGGYQAFWRLQDPMPIDGDMLEAERAKLYNMQLEMVFGADNCHNIDRIMRLPGTINLPDARKIKKGRKPELAKVVTFTDASYKLSSFVPAPEVQIKGESGFAGRNPEKLVISGNVERILDASELDQWDVPDRVKVVMAQGSHPDQSKDGDNSRSAWLFDFCCNMARCGVPDEVIFSVITDPGWGISESVVEMKGNADKYAMRQISRAKEWVVDPMLVEFNDEYAVIKNLGGQCLVITEVDDPALKRKRFVKMSLESFCKGYENRKVHVGEDANGNPKYEKAGRWWRYHPERRQYNSLVFAPECQIDPSIYNMWSGFAVPSIPGECGLYLDHIRGNICKGDTRLYNYVIGWMARTVQEPSKPGEVALVLRGGRGVGKSVFAAEFGKLFGSHFMQIANSSHLVGNFNAHLRDLVVLFADEAFYANDKKHESVLKMLVTESMMAVEAKGVDVEMANNCIHLIMASNDAHVVPAGGDERRFCVLEIGNTFQQNSSYFGAIIEQMNSGGREALLHYLRSYDLEGFDVRAVPQTEALREQKMLSLTTEEEWWFHKLCDGQLLTDGDGWPREIQSKQLLDDYLDHTKRFQVNRRGTQTQLGKFLSNMCPGLCHTRRVASIEVPTGDGFMRKVKKKCKFLNVPSLEECRTRWEELHGQEDWDDVDPQPELTEQAKEPPF